MKNNKFIPLVLSVLMMFVTNSCTELYPEKDIIYTPWYQFNYHLVNKLDSDVTFYFYEQSITKGIPPIEKTITLAPSVSKPLYSLSERGGIYKDSTTTGKPVLTPDHASVTVLFNPRDEKEKALVTTYLLIGDTQRDFDFELDNHPFFSKNYQVEVVQDTIFNFYFSIDSTFVKTLK